MLGDRLLRHAWLHRVRGQPRRRAIKKGVATQRLSPQAARLERLRASRRLSDLRVSEVTLRRYRASVADFMAFALSEDFPLTSSAAADRALAAYVEDQWANEGTLIHLLAWGVGHQLSWRADLPFCDMVKFPMVDLHQVPVPELPRLVGDAVAVSPYLAELPLF